MFLSKEFLYLSCMSEMDKDIFKIQSNDIQPSRGKVLISEPFLCDDMFSRSVILLVDHTSEGSMGLVMNKQLPVFINEVINEFKYLDDIPLYKGGPIGMDTLFYLHRFDDIPGALKVSKDLFLNGDFTAIKKRVFQEEDIQSKIRFFVGYSGWEESQLAQEIEENTWIIGKGESSNLFTSDAESMWKETMSKQGSKYETWSRFPLIPIMN